MTRLKVNDIENIAGYLEAYDKQLMTKTGRTLLGIACHAASIGGGTIWEEKCLPLTDSTTIGVVPVKSGLGIIGGFSTVVKEILCHIGFNAFVTQKTDVAGTAEAVEKGARLMMMADDQRFVALDIHNGRLVDNTPAAAKGFMAGLDLMSGGLKGKTVLILGCGPVGRAAVSYALQMGAEVEVFDINRVRCREMVRSMGQEAGNKIRVMDSPEKGFSHRFLIFDATNAADVIGAGDIGEDTYIAAPGMPPGLTAQALDKISHRLLHDPLQIGVAVMAVESIVKKNVSSSTQEADPCPKQSLRDVSPVWSAHSK
ncbi:MAG: 3-methylornithyl-N6-L-lysine dehydrogenase PylD [bacterium]|nr:3-methylornithyl-N6-L-lysine dehydrogenase PylD [bacterium]